MTGTLILEEGHALTTRWKANQRHDSRYPIKSNWTTDGHSDKIILPELEDDGCRPLPDETWVCRINKITGPVGHKKGAIFVRPIQRKLAFNFKDVWIDPDDADAVAIGLQDRRCNVMFEGDQGFGKSTTARAIAKELGWEFHQVSCGAIKKVNHMTGRFNPRASGKNLAWDFVHSKAISAVLAATADPKRKHLLMADEFTRMEEDARDIWLDFLEGQVRSIRLPTGQDIVVPPNLVFMGAGNIGAGFTVKRQDAAARDRWLIFKIKPMPYEREVEHCRRLYPECPLDKLGQAITIIHKIREARFRSTISLSKIPSVRVSERVAMLLNGGMRLEYCLNTAVTNQYDGYVANANSEAGRVQGLIDTELKGLQPKAQAA